MERIELDWIEALADRLASKIIWLELKSMSKPGENYASILTRATLAYRDNDTGGERRMNVVVKSPIHHNDPAVSHSLQRYFKAEIMMYRKVIKVFDHLISERNLFEKIWPDCYFISSSDVIVLQDLKTVGFELPRQLFEMDEEHALIVLTAVARFHALSVVAVERGLLNPDDPHYSFFFTEEGLGDNFVLTGMQSVADAILETWPPKWRSVGEKLLTRKATIMSELRQLEKEETRVRVINHGDLWSRNMFLSYSEEKRPQHVRLLDLQCPHYNSFCLDLSLFMAACLTVDTRRALLDVMMESYCRVFRDTLVGLDTDPALAPTEEECYSEMRRLEVLSMVVTCTGLPLSFYEGDEAVTMEDYMDLDASRTKETRNSIYCGNPRLTHVLQQSFTYFSDIDVL